MRSIPNPVRSTENNSRMVEDLQCSAAASLPFAWCFSAVPRGARGVDQAVQGAKAQLKWSPSAFSGYQRDQTVHDSRDPFCFLFSDSLRLWLVEILLQGCHSVSTGWCLAHESGIHCPVISDGFVANHHGYRMHSRAANLNQRIGGVHPIRSSPVLT